MHLRGLCILTLTATLALATPLQAGRVHNTDCRNRDIDFRDYSMDFEDAMLVMKHHDYPDETVKITEDFELIVNGKRVRTDGKQRRLVEAYYHQVERMEDFAIELGKEGARVGIEGAALAVKALAKVCLLLSRDYDSEDLERDMDIEVAKVEARAETLEEKAEIIEEWADQLEELGEALREQIPELQELEWF